MGTSGSERFRCGCGRMFDLYPNQKQAAEARGAIPICPKCFRKQRIYHLNHRVHGGAGFGWRGSRLYRCADCGAERWVGTRAINNAARIRCIGCGSIAVDPASDQAKRDVRKRNTERVFGDFTKESRLGLEHDRRKVTGGGLPKKKEDKS